MFEKKTYIYSESMGVCYIEDVTKLITARKTEVMYYVLRPLAYITSSLSVCEMLRMLS